MVRPLMVHGDELKYFVFQPFKMLNMFIHPTHVNDSWLCHVQDAADPVGEEAAFVRADE